MASARNMSAPLIGVPADSFMRGKHVFHGVGDKYVRAVAVAANALPVMIPALGTVLRLSELLAHLDGLVLPGSVSNVHPANYGTAPTPDHEPYDDNRDATTLDLIRMALDMEVPLLAICRGLQELNVALGGTLQAEVQKLPGKIDHREPDVEEMDMSYAPRHKIKLAPGGKFHTIFGAGELEVNSLHRQAIARLAERLQVEATAADGTIEGVSVRNSETFALGVQWHPEYKVLNNQDSVKLFEAFGAAAAERLRKRTTGELGIARAVSA